MFSLGRIFFPFQDFLPDACFSHGPAGTLHAAFLLLECIWHIYCFNIAGGSLSVIKNYLRVAFRNLRRQKIYSGINVVGLALGMACCILLFRYLQHEWSFDRFHDNADRIYRVLLRSESGGNIRFHAGAPAPLAQTWLQEFPGLEKAARFSDNTFVVQKQDKRFRERIFFSDPDIFEIFDFPLMTGDPRFALTEPDTLVITEKMQDKYFGSEDPLNQVLMVDDLPYRITGVLKNIPSNSHLQFDFLGSFRRFERAYADRWGVSNFPTYFLIQNDFSFEDYARRMPELVEKYRGKEARIVYGVTFPLEPLVRIHLYSQASWDMGAKGDIDHLYIFSAVAMFVLLIACFNTINLSTARSLTRAREVGLRKVVGAGRGQVALQFLGESYMMTAVSIFLSLGLGELLLPVFNQLTGHTLKLDLLSDPLMLLFLLGIFGVVGNLSGGAMVLAVSRFQPSQVIKGSFMQAARIPKFRRIMIVSQFTLSIAFILLFLVIFNQIHYMQTKKLGYTREQVLSVPLDDKEAFAKRDALKTELLRSPDILDVSAASFSPGRPIWYQSFRYEGMPDDLNPMIRWIAADYDFIRTLDLKLFSGRDFSRTFPSDAGGAYILNETAVRSIGWQDPLGKRLQVVGEGTVIGVLNDFHFQSLHHPIEPLALYIWPEGCENLLVRVRAGHLLSALKHTQSSWEKTAPGSSYSYAFLDDAYNSLYLSEIRLGRVFAYVTAISLFIACSGLFGLASFSTQRRIKEIGIRKVLGASVSGVVSLFSRELINLVVLANLIAWPISYWIMSGWLERFAYRIQPGLFMFLLAGLLSLCVSLLPVIFLALRAARNDPVESLRYE